MGRRRRSRGSSGRLLWWVAILGLVAVVAFAGVPAGSVTSAELPREISADVVADVDGALALDVAGGVRKNKIDPLVNVTNSLGTGVTVTVSLQNGSDGDLYVGGTNVGNTATFGLASGNTRTVDIEAQASPGSDVYFDVSATSTDIDVTANNRNTTVTSSGGGCGSPPCGGGP